MLLGWGKQIFTTEHTVSTEEHPQRIYCAYELLTFAARDSLSGALKR